MEVMIEKLLNFMMVLTRISAFFLVAPVFSWKSLPLRIKVALTILISIFFATITPSSINAYQVTPLRALLILGNESIYGFALGLIAMLLFSAVKACGRIIERQMGMAMAQILDPLTGDQGQPIGMLLVMVFIILFLTANGHHLFLLIISKSYEAFPAGTIPSITILLTGIAKASSTMLVAALRLSAPILAAFLLLMVILAVLARVAPETNILFISFPIRIGLGLMMTMTFLPFIKGFVAEFADWMGKLMPL